MSRVDATIRCGCRELPALDARTLEAFRLLPDLTGMISDALDLHGIDGAIGAARLGPTLTNRRIVGPALTALQRRRSIDVATAARHGDNRLAGMAVHELARPGDVIVIQGVDGISSLGGILATVAVRQGEAGIIVDGAIRDVDSIRASGLPIWTREITPVTGKWRLECTGVNVEIEICGIRVHPGDLVAADGSGVCIVPHAAIPIVLATAQSIALDEAQRHLSIQAGTPGPLLQQAPTP